MAKQVYDVIVIGTGAGGGMAIKTLCEAGLKVCALNAGRKLDPEKAKSMQIEKINVDKATFDKMHAADRMASDKLKEGIEGFSKALEELEKTLAKRLVEISEPAAAR